MNSPLTKLNIENKNAESIYIWVEPAAYQIEIDTGYECLLIIDEEQLEFRMENDGITLWFQTRFGFKLLSRKLRNATSKPPDNWEEEIDLSDIQFPEKKEANPNKKAKKPLKEVVFENHMEDELFIWIEPVAHGEDIPPASAFRLMHDDPYLTLTIEEENVGLTLQSTVGCALYLKENSEDWELLIDYTGI